MNTYFPLKLAAIGLPNIKYMANKPDKFRIWVAADITSKCFLNGFSYLGKDDSRPADESLPENIVL